MSKLLPTTTSSGAPHYANLYKIAGKEIVQLKTAIHHLEEDRTARDNDLIEAEAANEQLRVEACMSRENREEMLYYRKSTRFWCGAFWILAITVISFPAWGM